MLVIQSADSVTEVGYTFTGTPYIKGASIKDYPHILELANKLKKLKVPTRLPDINEARLATLDYEHLIDLVIYNHKYVTIILNLNDGSQYAVPKRFRTKGKSDESYYGDIPCYAYEWNEYKKGETPFHIVSPPGVLHSDMYSGTHPIESETEHWDTNEVLIKEGDKYVHLFRSKKEHVLIKYVTTFSEPYLIPRETRNSIAKWHSVLNNPSVDPASISTLLYK